MAKGSLSGVRKGKKGDSVYYRVAASNNKEKQGERQYVGEVTNPRTDAQVEQRMKMTPAVNFYRALKDDVLDHSFQGVKYGARSHSEFMKQAMLMNLGQIPYVPKGENMVIPAPYLLSKGGLPDMGVFGINNNYFRSAIDTAFVGVDLYQGTYADFVDELLANNPMLKKGDQLTFISFGESNTGVSAHVGRLTLDASKYATDADAVSVCSEAGVTINGMGIAFNVDDTEEPVAAGIIVSRPNVAKTNGAVTWSRSTTSLYVLPSFLAKWQTEEKLNLAIESYKTKGANPTSDWYLNDGTLG